MLNDIKNSTRVTGGFLAALALILCIGVLARQSLLASGASARELAEHHAQGASGLEDMVLAQQRITAAEIGLSASLRADPIARRADYTELEDGLKQLDKGRQSYDSTPMDPQAAAVWRSLESVLETSRRAIQNTL